LRRLHCTFEALRRITGRAGFRPSAVVRGESASGIEPIGTGYMDTTKKQPPTFEQALKQGDERQERELQGEPEALEDKLLNEPKRDKPEPRDYDKL